MPRFRPDPTFYASPSLAGEAPPEQLAYVALLATRDGQRDALGVVDTEPRELRLRPAGRPGRPSRRAGTSCTTSAGTPAARTSAPTPPTRTSSAATWWCRGRTARRIHVLDTKPDPRDPRAGQGDRGRGGDGQDRLRRPAHGALRPRRHLPERARRAGRRRSRAASSCSTTRPSSVKGRWEQDRGPQYLAYDFAWHLGQDTMITSEWGTPNMVKDGVNPELLLAGKYGHTLHVWDLRRRTPSREARPRRPAPDGARAAAGPRPEPRLRLRRRGDLARGPLELDLACGTSTGRARNGQGRVEDAEGDRRSRPSRPIEADLPPLLKGFKAVPPLVTDINLSLDDRFLYVSCWGTGELRQYDVTDPFNPVLTGSVQLGGIVRRTRAPEAARTSRSTAGRRWSR